MSKIEKACKVKARAVAWGAKQTNKGDPAIAVKFVVVDGEHKDEELYWQGGLNDQGAEGRKSQLEITLDALEACGFDAGKHRDLSVLAEGPAGGALDGNRDVMLTVEIETWEGKPQVRVKWVNDIAGAKFHGALQKDEFALKCKGLGVEAALMKRRGGKPAAAPAQAPAAAANIPDIPF